jgi:hypothetical protein
MSPTARSLTWLRDRGFIADVTERWVPHINRRRDLFGFADLLAAHPRDGLIMLVQVTSVAHVAHRLAKAKARPELAAWLRAGGTFEVHGWTKKDGRWHCKRVAVRSEDLTTVVLSTPPRRHRRRRDQEQRTLFEDFTS